jgi:transcriptional regulator GlxA family with amidase domain
VSEGGRKVLGTLLFPGFELLDVFGPLELFGHLPDRIRLVLVGPHAGGVASAQGPAAVADVGREECPPLDLLLVPGGIGTRTAVNDAELTSWIGERAAAAELVMSVCTGAALLARAGVLDGRRATTNKRAFAWVESQGPAVQWIKRARWVRDGNRVTSSGVSAGMDMSLAVIAGLFGERVSEEIAAVAEYEPHRDPDRDPFAVRAGLVATS